MVRHRVRSTSILLACLFLPGTAVAEPLVLNLLEPASTVDQRWKRKTFPFTKRTDYHIEAEKGRVVLTGTANDAASARLFPVEVRRPSHAVLRWGWRARSTFDGTPPETTKAGDDFAARVFVVFETSWLPTRTWAINYVWSAREPVGARFVSPYTDRVFHVVLQSGSDSTDADVAWRFEERDVLKDYEACFGKAPGVISAVAVMTDTDNTGRTATAWITDLELEISPAPAASPP